MKKLMILVLVLVLALALALCSCKKENPTNSTLINSTSNIYYVTYKISFPQGSHFGVGYVLPNCKESDTACGKLHTLGKCTPYFWGSPVIGKGKVFSVSQYEIEWDTTMKFHSHDIIQLHVSGIYWNYLASITIDSDKYGRTSYSWNSDTSKIGNATWIELK